MSADVVVLRHPTLRDVPGTLRRLADEIEAGGHGDVRGCAYVLDVRPVVTGYTGDGEAVPTAHLLLSAGALQLAADLLEGDG